MKTENKMGALAAWSLILIYIIGIALNTTILDTSKITDGVEMVAFMKLNATLMYSSTTLLYVVFGGVLLVLSIVLYDLLKEKTPFGAKIATSFGVIWTTLLIASGMVHNVGMGMAIKLLETNPVEAGTFFKGITAMHIGLGGGNEIAGAMWTLLVSICAMQSGLFKRWINVVGIIVGIAGVLTIIPSLFIYTVSVFALGQMIWWFGMGRELLKKSK